MFRKLLVLLTISVAFAAYSCASSPTKRFFTLTNSAEFSGEGRGDVECARSVVVDFVDVVAPFSNDKVVFRTDALEVKFFNYQVWVESPPDMLQKLISGRLEHAGLFEAVEAYIDSSSDHLVLSVKLAAIEEVIDGKDHMARLALRFQLRDPIIEKAVWSHGFDTSVKYSYRSDEPELLIENLNGIYNKEMDRMIPLLRKAIVAYEKCVK